MNVVSPPRISRPYVDPRAVTKKNRSSQDRPDGLGSSDSPESRVLESSCVMFPSWRDRFRRVWLNIVAGTSSLPRGTVPSRAVLTLCTCRSAPIRLPTQRHQCRAANAGHVFVVRPFRFGRAVAAAGPSLFATVERQTRYEGHDDRRCAGT